MAHSLAEYSLVSTAPPVVVAHSFAAPLLAVVVTFVPPTAQAFELKSVPVTAPSTLSAYDFELVAVVPRAYSFAEYSLVSTAPPVVVAHSFAAPLLDVVVTPVPPIAHAFEEMVSRIYGSICFCGPFLGSTL